MKDIRLVVTINQPASEVFDFTVNPNNTPKWIDAIVKEETNESPAKLGTIYKSQGKDGSWGEMKITAFDPGKSFVMSKMGGSHHVRYTIKPLSDDTCELEYYVWAGDGDIPALFAQENLQKLLQKLKQVVET